MIYFIQERGRPDALIKIGYTASLRKRLRDLGNGHGGELDVLACIGGDRQIEAALHRQFASLRAKGEWFRPDGPLLEFVRRLPNKVDVPDFRAKKRGITKGHKRHVAGNFRQNFAAALRKRLGKPPLPSIGQLAAAISVTENTVRNWLQKRTSPDSFHMLQLGGLFGHAFMMEAWATEYAEVKGEFQQRKRAELQRLQSEEQILNLLAGNDA